MRSWQQRWAAIGWLALTGAMPARAAGMLAAGTELIYTGTLERKEAQTGISDVTYRARETLSALVARADPQEGYTVLFFASCNAEAPHLEKEYWQTFRDKGVVVIGIDTAEESHPKEKAGEFRQKHELTYPILLDETGAVAKAYRVQGFPTNVIIDREGKVRYIAAGFNAAAIDQALQQLIAK